MTFLWFSYNHPMIVLCEITFCSFCFHWFHICSEDRRLVRRPLAGGRGAATANARMVMFVRQTLGKTSFSMDMLGKSWENLEKSWEDLGSRSGAVANLIVWFGSCSLGMSGLPLTLWGAFLAVSLLINHSIFRFGVTLVSDKVMLVAFEFFFSWLSTAGTTLRCTRFGWQISRWKHPPTAQKKRLNPTRGARRLDNQLHQATGKQLMVLFRWWFSPCCTWMESQ